MRYLLAIIFISILTAGFSQQQFIQSGKITYERKLGQFTLMESIQQDGENMFWEEMKKVLPRIVTDSYVLDFYITLIDRSDTSSRRVVLSLVDALSILVHPFLSHRRYLL
jgi:hypothetical protein